MIEFATWIIGIAAVALALGYSIIFAALFNAKRRMDGSTIYTVRRHIGTIHHIPH